MWYNTRCKYTQNIINHNDDFNERMNTLPYKNIPLTLYSWKGDVSCVWEVTWRRGQTATYWPQVLLTIAALLSHSGWAAQPWVTESPSPLSGASSHSAGIHLQLELTHSYRLCSGYIFVWRTPASAVLPLIYTGASLDWRLGRGSIWNA